jgi:hypothetical protein
MITNATPKPMSKLLKTLEVFFLSNRIENKIWAIAGINMMPINNEDTSAKVFVQAKGLNNFPSEACIAKTGKKLTTVVVSAVMIAEATSVVAI